MLPTNELARTQQQVRVDQDQSEVAGRITAMDGI